MKFKPIILLSLVACSLDYGYANELLQKIQPGLQAAVSKNDTLNKDLLGELFRMRLLQIVARSDHFALVDMEMIVKLNKKQNTRLKEIIAEFGWPGIRLLGLDGSSAMRKLVHYQTGDLEFQKTCLELLHEAVEKQDAQFRDYAFLLDEILVLENKPQIYGTKWTCKEGKYTLYPTQDLENLNQRRQEAGLCSFEEYKEYFKQSFFLTDTDFE